MERAQQSEGTTTVIEELVKEEGSMRKDCLDGLGKRGKRREQANSEKKEKIGKEWL